MLIGARTLFDGFEVRGPSIVEIADGAIAGISTETLRESDLHGSCDAVVDLLAPGFVDIQVNGWESSDVADGTTDSLDRLCATLASLGTTSFLATLTTARLDRLNERLTALDEAIAGRRAGGTDGASANAVGIHLEGPFLGSRHGAHPGTAVLDVDDRTAQWIDALPGSVRLVTLGCEAPEAPAAIGALVHRGIVAALGHTAPDESAFSRAVAAGASLVTHLYNAMSGVHHRDDGLAAMALTTDAMNVSLIADGVHVGRRAATIAFRTKPAGTVALVSDAVAWAAPRLLDAGATLGADGAVRLPNGTLAGAATSVADGVRRLVADWGLGLGEVLRAATSTPARILGLTDRGRLDAGLRADLVALDDDLRLVAVWVGGRSARA